MVCVCSYVQAPVQAVVRPAMWLPLINRLHSHKERWLLDGNIEEYMDDLVKAVQLLKEEEMEKGCCTYTYDVHKVDKEAWFIRVFVFTKAEWLDVVEVQFKDGEASAKSFSSGLFPLSIPFAFLLNCVLFWVPFYDNQYNKKWLENIRLRMSKLVTVVTDVSEKPAVKRNTYVEI